MNEHIRTRMYHPNAGWEELLADDADTMGVVRTMRLKTGDHFACFNGDGMENLYRIETVEKRLMTAVLIQQKKNTRDPQAALTVMLASTKGKSKDQMVKELTALGAAKIIVYQAHRSIAKPEEKQTERLQKIAIESCRQCERSTVPEVKIIARTLEELEEDVFSEAILCFYEKAAWDDVPKIEKPDSHITLVFGPEGGFSDDEVSFLKQKDAQLCSLGKRIYRAELAVAVGTALVQGQRGEL